MSHDGPVWRRLLLLAGPSAPGIDAVVLSSCPFRSGALQRRLRGR